MTVKTIPAHCLLEEFEVGFLDIVAEQLCLPRPTVLPAQRLIEDLHCDSLELTEFLMAIEFTKLRLRKPIRDVFR
jgi:hypothetical protein